MNIQFLFLILVIVSVSCENKYSKSANEKKKIDVDFRNLEKPFRINKLNLLWTKARQRLTEPKLKSLYSDLMIQDKEELIYKRLKSEGGDKEGLKEAELRRKLNNIMSSYGLLHHFEPDAPVVKENPKYNAADDYINKSLFKDKKLNYLWSKAEMSGFTMEELVALREEFSHHQEKIDQYYNLLDDNPKSDVYKNVLNEDELDRFNEISQQTNEVTKDYLDKSNLIRDKHRDLRDGYDKLQRVIAKGPNNRDFIEPKVQGLWKLAVDANFTTDELSSLKVELQHYESRLLKLRHLQATHVNNQDKQSKVAAAGDKINHFEEQEQMIKKHSSKVQKMHSDLEGRIMARHTEL